MKRVFSLMLCFFVIIGTFALGSKGLSQFISAFSIKANAEIYDDLSYEIVDGEVKITGCDENICGELIIPSSIDGYHVTNIDDFAFFEHDSLTSIILPDSVTSIGDGVFSGCSGLTSITIPNSVTSIGDGAFSRCSGLTSITIPNSVTSIGDGAFSRCSGLTSITIPDSVTSIGYGAFEGCTSFTSIVLPESVTSIGARAFCWCDSLTSITIPNSVTSISDGAFSECSDLTSITISDSVTSIGVDAFRFCGSLTRVTFAKAIKAIENGAFFQCDSLSEVYYKGTESDRSYISIGIENEDLENATWHYNYSEQKEHFLTYNANGGTYNLLTDQGSEYIIIANSIPIRDGYTFIGWALSADATAAQYQPGASLKLTTDITLYAVWKKDASATSLSITDDNPNILNEAKYINNYIPARTVDYKTTITFSAPGNIPDGATVHWIVNGKDVAQGRSYTNKSAISGYTVQSKVVDVTGNVIAESEVETVTVDTGFFAKLIAFFRELFGLLPVTEQ